MRAEQTARTLTGQRLDAICLAGEQSGELLGLLDHQGAGVGVERNGVSFGKHAPDDRSGRFGQMRVDEEEGCVCVSQSRSTSSSAGVAVGFGPSSYVRYTVGGPTSFGMRQTDRDGAKLSRRNGQGAVCERKTAVKPAIKNQTMTLAKEKAFAGATAGLPRFRRSAPKQGNDR